MDANSGRQSWLEPTQIGRELDEACDRFEATWRAGTRATLEHFLGDATDPGYSVLFRYLLAVELDYRGVLGEKPESADYLRRFPGHEALIDAVFARFAKRFEPPPEAELETIDVSIARDGNSSESAVSPAADSFPKIPGCEILSELGRGGMGVVYKARQTRLNRLCALKIALPGHQASARFLAEAGTIARLSHPNIVQIYDVGEHEGVPYFAMEYVEGGSLARRLDGTPWAPEPAARMVAILAGAIGSAHRLGIVHRDLKPGNVLLTDDETPKVVDFGLAKLLEDDSRLTQSGVFVGTPSYASPEQVECKAVGPAADIHAVGAIFYQMLTGRPPFQGATLLQTLEQVKTADPVPPSQLQPGLPRDVETITLKCLEKDPHRRYANAAALTDDLERFLSGRPILARPIGSAERLWKWAKRRPTVAALSAAVAAITILGVILVAWQWRRAEDTALAEAAANTRMRQAWLVASEERARLTLHQALALCEQGEIGRGLSHLARSLELATEARSPVLEQTIRINLSDWGSQLCRPLQLAPIRHSAPILGCAFRREGKEIIAVGEDGLARTWDTATGREIGSPLDVSQEAPGVLLKRARFSPGENGLLGTVDDSGRVTVWDIDQRRRLASTSTGSIEPLVRDIALPNRHVLITWSNDGKLRWSVIGCRREKPVSHQIEIPSGRRQEGDMTLAVSSDGRTLAAAGPGRRVVRWDVTTKSPLEPESYHDSPLGAITLTPDGRTVITGRSAGRLQIWDSETERAVDLPPQGTEVLSFAVSPDGRVLASGTEGGVVRLWDTALVAQIGQTCKFAAAVSALAFDPRGKVVAIAGEDGAIRLQRVPSPRTIGSPLRVDQPVLTVNFEHSGRRLLIGTTEGSRWLDLAGRVGRKSHRAGCNRLNAGQSSRLGAAKLSPDGRTLATARRRGGGDKAGDRVELWDAITGKFLRQTPDQHHAISGLAYSPDSKLLLTWGPGPKTVRLWDTSTLQHSRPVFRVADSGIIQAVFSRDGQSLLLGCRDGRARLWDPHRDVELDPEHRPRHSYPITAVAFDPERSRLVTGCHAGTIRIWDAAHHKMVHELRQNAGEIVVLAFSPDAATLVTASHDGTARFLDSESGVQLGPTLHHADAVLCAVFHPDGKSVVTGTRDGMVQQWSAPSPVNTGSVTEIRRWVQDLTGTDFYALLPPEMRP